MNFKHLSLKHTVLTEAYSHPADPAYGPLTQQDLEGISAERYAEIINMNTPDNPFKLVTDTAHWAQYGVETGADLDAYLNAEDRRADRKDMMDTDMDMMMGDEEPDPALEPFTPEEKPSGFELPAESDEDELELLPSKEPVRASKPITGLERGPKPKSLREAIQQAVRLALASHK